MGKEITQKIYCCGCRKTVEAKLVGGDIIHPHRPDLSSVKFYQCSCGLYVGCHKKRTLKWDKKRVLPLGCIPTKELRKARQQIHAILDPLWKSKEKNTRSGTYKKLSEKLGYKYHTAEILSVVEARRIYKIIKTMREHG